MSLPAARAVECTELSASPSSQESLKGGSRVVYTCVLVPVASKQCGPCPVLALNSMVDFKLDATMNIFGGTFGDKKSPNSTQGCACSRRDRCKASCRAAKRLAQSGELHLLRVHDGPPPRLLSAALGGTGGLG